MYRKINLGYACRKIDKVDDLLQIIKELEDINNDEYLLVRYAYVIENYIEIGMIDEARQVI